MIVNLTTGFNLGDTQITLMDMLMDISLFLIEKKLGGGGNGEMILLCWFYARLVPFD